MTVGSYIFIKNAVECARFDIVLRGNPTSEFFCGFSCESDGKNAFGIDFELICKKKNVMCYRICFSGTVTRKNKCGSLAVSYCFVLVWIIQDMPSDDRDRL